MGILLAELEINCSRPLPADEFVKLRVNSSPSSCEVQGEWSLPVAHAQSLQNQQNCFLGGTHQSSGIAMRAMDALTFVL